MRKPLNYLLFRIQLILTLVTLLAFATPEISPLRFWPAAFLGLLIPFLLFAHVAFLLWWILQRRYYFLFALASIIAGWSHIPSIASFSFSSSPDLTETSLSTLTYNVRGLRHTADNSQVSTENIARLATDKNVDLLCLQEFPNAGKSLHQLKEALLNATRLKFHYYDQLGNFALFSAYPIFNPKTSYFPNRANGYQQVNIQVGRKIVRIINVHLQSNALTQVADRVASSGNIKEKKTWRDIGSMLRRYKRAAQQRAKQAKEIAALVNSSAQPIIIMGDINDTPYSYTYRTLTRIPLQDAFRQKGKGLGITYAGSIPTLRIDYILCSPDIRILDHETERTDFSDHRPVWSRLAINQE